MMSDPVEMKVDPARAAALVSQLKGVSEKIAAVAKGRPVSVSVIISSSVLPTCF